MPLTIELPSREEQLAFNRKRWSEVLADAKLAKVEERVETNRHGQILMTPPPSGSHSSKQGRFLLELHSHLGGRVLPECPISTVDGVRAADVGWYSEERFREVEGQLAFELAPEICVEVLSPSNTAREIEEKRALYFEAEAEEVWICDLDGAMNFYHRESAAEARTESRLCPDFPHRL